MERRTRNLFALALVVVIAITGGAALILGGSGTRPSPPATSNAFQCGVVVGVDARSPTDVRSFDLRRVDGGTVTFGLAELENGVEFPPGHLAEHQLSGSPICAHYRRGSDGGLLATRLEDAP